MTDYAWHVHHDKLWEALDDTYQARCKYIERHKPRAEVALRLQLFKISRRLKLLVDDYYAKLKPVDDDYYAKRKLLVDDYYAKRKLLVDDYNAKRKLLDDDYNAKRKLLDDDYNAKRKRVEAPIIRLHRRECPDCPWNGKTIFARRT